VRLITRRDQSVSVISEVFSTQTVTNKADRDLSFDNDIGVTRCNRIEIVSELLISED